VLGAGGFLVRLHLGKLGLELVLHHLHHQLPAPNTQFTSQLITNHSFLALRTEKRGRSVNVAGLFNRIFGRQKLKKIDH
jgi:hypothetical protein